MQLLGGVALLVGGIALAFYVGFYLMLVGGVVDIIAAIKAPVTEVWPLFKGLLKIVFASFTGTISFWLLALPGAAMLNMKIKRRR